MSEPHDDGGPIQLPPNLFSENVHAPWTPAQVRAIEAWQAAGNVHPLICEVSEHGALQVATHGLWCAACDYEQRWVPWMCAETFPSDHAPSLGEFRPLVNQVAERVIKLTADRVVALTIAIKLMEMHLELATPAGAGRDSLAWTVAQGRLEVLRGLLDELRASQPPQPSVD